MSHRRYLTLALFAFTLGCSRHAAVVVEIDSDIEAPEQLRFVRVVGTRDDGKEVANQSFYFPRPDAGAPAALPDGGAPDLGAPSGDIPAGAKPMKYAGTVSFYSDDGSEVRLKVDVIANPDDKPELVRQTARFSLPNGRTAHLRMGLYKNCIGVKCGSEQTCVDGHCESIDVDTRDAPDFDPRKVGLIQCGAAKGTTLVGGGCRPDQRCRNWQCVAYKKSCYDSAQNGDEVDIDCGGSCPACRNGAHCDNAADCQSRTCQAQDKRCVSPDMPMPAHCTNGKVDGDETDRDCGGSCMRCDLGHSCKVNGDCRTDNCDAGACAAPIGIPFEERSLPILGLPDGGVGPISFTFTDITAADFNGDGDTDLAGLSASRQSVFLFLRSGANFRVAAEKQILIDNIPSVIQAARLNDDSYDDLLITGQKGNSRTITTLLSDTNGNLGAPTTYDIDVTLLPARPLISDLDNDGDPDLAIGSGNATVSILFADARGNLQRPVRYATSASPVTIAAGDFNGDRLPDLILNIESGATPEILFGLGGGVFSQPYTLAAAQSPDSSGIAVGDFNRDGHDDLGWHARAGFVALLGRGDGTFPTRRTSPDVTPFFYTIHIDDFNNDGLLDFTNTSSDIFIALGNGDGTFRSPPGIRNNACASIVAVADFDRNGLPDFACVELNGTAVHLYLNKSAR